MGHFNDMEYKDGKQVMKNGNENTEQSISNPFQEIITQKQERYSNIKIILQGTKLKIQYRNEDLSLDQYIDYQSLLTSDIDLIDFTISKMQKMITAANEG